MKIKPSYLIYPSLLIGISIFCIFYFSYKPSIREGELSFFRDNELCKKITIAADETNQFRMQDILYQDSMPDSCGMLFIFHEEAQMPLGIYKRHQPFDFIFITSDHKVVVIKKNISPSVPQIKLCYDIIAYNFALVVNAGFCNTYSISEDDSIAFNLIIK